MLRLVPAAAALFVALPAAAHEIGVGHSHAAMESSMIVALLAVAAGLGFWWTSRR
jgi:hypothetical protein